VPPHSTLQDALPPHSAVHPPFGQRIAHALLPWQSTVEPVSRVSVQSLPPVQVTVLLVPVESVHSLVPAQLDVQLSVQVPSHTERPAHVAVQPVPHVRSQLFFASQRYVTSFGRLPPLGAAPESSVAVSPASLAGTSGPNVQVPPASQLHVSPEQSQSPRHMALPTSLEAPQAVAPASPTDTSPTDNHPAKRETFIRDLVVLSPEWASAARGPHLSRKPAEIGPLPTMSGSSPSFL
jgi:hypothetical protein